MMINIFKKKENRFEKENIKHRVTGWGEAQGVNDSCIDLKIKKSRKINIKEKKSIIKLCIGQYWTEKIGSTKV